MNPALDKLFELDNVLRHAAAAYAKDTCLNNLNALRASAFAFGSLAVEIGDVISAPRIAEVRETIAGEPAK